MNKPGWVKSPGIGVPDDGERARGILLFQARLVYGGDGRDYGDRNLMRWSQVDSGLMGCIAC